MKKCWLIIGLCCGALMFCGCTNEKQSGDSNDSIQEQEMDAEDSGQKATEVEPGTGEGTSSMELEDLSESKEYSVGETISMSVDGSDYELQIDSVSYTEQREKHSEETERVVLVDYSYRNLSDAPLLIGDIRFQLTDSEKQKVYEPYYFNEQVAAEPVEKGESASAQVAFVQDDENNTFFLVYTDMSSENEVPIVIKIDEVKNN